MASPGKKRYRGKVTSSLFAEVGEQLQLPLTVLQICGTGLGDHGRHTNSMVCLRWGHSPPEKTGEHQGEIHLISALDELLSLLWYGPGASLYDHMPPYFTGSPGPVPRREMVYRGSWVVKAESQIVFSAFLLLFPVASSLAHAKAQTLPPCARSPVGRGSRTCRKSRVFLCSWDMGWAHSNGNCPLGMISAASTLSSGRNASHAEGSVLTQGLGLMHLVSTIFGDYVKEWSMCIWLRLKFSKSHQSSEYMFVPIG